MPMVPRVGMASGAVVVIGKVCSTHEYWPVEPGYDTRETQTQNLAAVGLA